MTPADCAQETTSNACGIATPPGGLGLTSLTAALPEKHSPTCAIRTWASFDDATGTIWPSH